MLLRLFVLSSEEDGFSLEEGGDGSHCDEGVGDRASEGEGEVGCFEGIAEDLLHRQCDVEDWNKCCIEGVLCTEDGGEHCGKENGYDKGENVGLCFFLVTGECGDGEEAGRGEEGEGNDDDEHGSYGLIGYGY